MKYRVMFEEKRFAQVDVDASSEDEAKDKAWEVISDGGGDWSDADTEYCDIEELSGD